MDQPLPFTTVDAKLLALDVHIVSEWIILLKKVIILMDLRKDVILMLVIPSRQESLLQLDQQKSQSLQLNTVSF